MEVFINYNYTIFSLSNFNFINKGCGGNDNNFETASECHQTCSSQKIDRIGQVSQEEETCSQDKLVGSCRGYFERYFYNSSASECQRFIYGGK